MMKLSNRFRQYVNIQALVAFSVFCFFYFIKDKQVASLFASAAFFSGSGFILYSESKFAGFKKRITFIATVLFLVLFAAPIFLLRVSHWGTPFAEIQIFGFQAQLLHYASNTAFILMLVCYFIDAYLLERQKN